MRIRHNILSYFYPTLQELLTFYSRQTNKHIRIDKFLNIKISNCVSALIFKKKSIFLLISIEQLI